MMEAKQESETENRQAVECPGPDSPKHHSGKTQVDKKEKRKRIGWTATGKQKRCQRKNVHQHQQPEDDVPGSGEFTMRFQDPVKKKVKNGVAAGGQSNHRDQGPQHSDFNLEQKLDRGDRDQLAKNGDPTQFNQPTGVQQVAFVGAGQSVFQSGEIKSNGVLGVLTSVEWRY